MERAQQESQPERFDFTDILNKFYRKDQSLRFVRLNTPVPGEPLTPLNFHGGWDSSTDNRSGTPVVTIGTEQLPDDKDRLFEWGAATGGEQLLVKAAHECAHVHQIDKGLDKALEDNLNHVPREMTREQVAYIDLYDIFNGEGSVTGLSTMDVYATQSGRAHLNMHALEDITELLGAYLLGDEYFLWRLNRLAMFSDDEKLEIAKRIDAIAPN